LLVSDSGFHELRRRLLKNTIWAADAIPPDEWKYRGFKRVLLPVYDVLLILVGVGAETLGVPAVGEFFSAVVIDIVAIAFALAGFLCLVGVSFPKMWALEAAAKSVCLGLLSAYVTTLLVLTADGDPARGVVTIIATAMMLVPIYRLSLLGAERRARHFVREVP
jgi:hypothetical protein